MNQSSLTLLVLAAGIGSRYGGLKQIEPVGPSGETVLDYSVYDALQAGYTEVAFVIRREMQDIFHARIGRRFESRIRIKYVHQETDRLPNGHYAPPERTKPWGTAHGVWCAARAIDHPFAVINADDFYGRESFFRLGAYLRSIATTLRPQQACMVGFQLAKTLSDHGTVSRGVCQLGESSQLIGVKECTAIQRSSNRITQQNADGSIHCFTGDEVVSMNCWGFLPDIFPLLDLQLGKFLEQDSCSPRAEFQLPTAVANFVNEGKLSVKILRSEADWFGVTYREDHSLVVQRLQHLIERRQYPAQLWDC